MESKLDKLMHRNDDIPNLGFEYKGQILKKTLSKSMYNNMRNENSLNVIDNLIFNIIESVKKIKNHRNWIWDENYSKFN